MVHNLLYFMKEFAMIINVLGGINMKKNTIKLLGISMSVLLLTTGCGKVPKLKNGEEAVVTFKNGDKISADDLYKEMKESYALETTLNLIDTKILEKEFKKDIDAAKEYAKSTIDSMKKSYGGEDKLLEMIQYYTGYASIEAYQNYIYINYLQNKAAEGYAKHLVTDKEIKKYFEDTYFGDISINHILITPSVKSGASEDETKKAEEDAKKKAEEVITKLNEAKKAGKDIKEEFKSLAKEYSNDDATKKKGGELGYININKLDGKYDELVNSATKLKNGEYSTKVITTELGYHIIYRVDQKDKGELKDAENSIRTILSKNYLSDQNITVKAMKYYREENGVKFVDSKIKDQYNKYLNNALNTNTTEAENK